MRRRSSGEQLDIDDEQSQVSNSFGHRCGTGQWPAEMIQSPAWSRFGRLSPFWPLFGLFRSNRKRSFTNRSNGFSAAKFRSPELNDTRALRNLQYVVLRPFGPEIKREDGSRDRCADLALLSIFQMDRSVVARKRDAAPKYFHPCHTDCLFNDYSIYADDVEPGRLWIRQRPAGFDCQSLLCRRRLVS